jgi:hypothetical protein
MNMILAKMHGLLHGHFVNGCCALSDFKSCLSSHSLPQMAAVITYCVSTHTLGEMVHSAALRHDKSSSL